MMKEFKFALYAIKKNFQSSAELRTSFVMNIFAMALNNTSFVILWVFFVKSVGVIGGWTAADVVGLQGFTTLSFGIVMSAGYGIRKLTTYVASGTFDRFMLSPKNLLTRVATSAFNTSALGDILFGIICLGAFIFLIHASLLQIALIAYLIFLATVISLAAMIAVFSTSFFFTDADAVSGGLFELFLTPSLFHGGAFHGAMRFIFTFIIPALAVGTLPVEAVRNMSLENIITLTILAVFWFILSILIFNYAVRKYESANFMTFGS